LLGSCDAQPLPSSTPDLVEHIYSRGIIDGTSLPLNSQALFNTTGHTPINNEVFTFNGEVWENENISIPLGTQSLTALYPAYNGNTFITINPYKESALEDVLISQNVITAQTNLNLEFKHLFAKLTIHVISAINETLTGVSVTVPKVSAINPIDGSLTFSGEHSTYLGYNSIGDYTFIIPSKENCPLKLTFSFENEDDIEKEITHTFVSGYQYECNVTDTDTRPGIKTVQDLIDFSLFINEESDDRPWSDFGYIEGEDTVYCLLNDLVMTGTEKLKPIGNHTQVPFAAIFDGRGHTISGLKISASNSTAGLFGRITPKSIIKKLHLNQCTSPSISSSASSGVGLLIGSCYGTIINCSVTNSTVTTTESYPTGGLVGNLHKSGNIINSFVQNTKVTSTGFVGSIAGSMNEANITNCYAASNTIKTGTYNGGIAGSAINSNITNCYIYKITHSNTTGRGQIIGEAQSSKIYRIFYDKTTITLIKNDINESNTISFNRGYNTENFKTNKENIKVFLLLNQWVEEQGDNSIYTSWKGSTNLPAVFTE
jgi:hypothetical protein